MLGESVAVDIVHACTGFYGWNGGGLRGGPQLFFTTAVPDLQAGRQMQCSMA